MCQGSGRSGLHGNAGSVVKRDKERAEFPFSRDTRLLSVTRAVQCLIRAGCNEKLAVGLQGLECHRQA